MIGELIETLKSEDRVQRRNAAIALGETGNALAIDALIEALGDGDNRVAEEAAEALGKIGDRRAVPALIHTLYHKSASTRVGAVKGLSDIADPSTIGRLIQVLQTDKDYLARRYAAIGLGRFGDARAAKALSDALETAPPDEKRYIVGALGSLKSEEAIPALLVELNEFGRRGEQAASALTSFGTRALDPVMRALPEVNTHSGRRHLVAYLSSVGEAAHGPLIAALTSSDRNAQLCAIMALGEMRASASITGLEELLLNDPETRDEAAHALAQIGAPAHKALSAAAEHPAPGVRRAVARSAALFEISEDVVDKGLNDSDPAVKAAAISTMTRAKKPLPGAPWRQMLVDPSPDVRAAAALAIVDLPVDELKSRLREALDDPDPHVRMCVCRALGALRDTAAIHLLLDRLEDVPEVVAGAAEALGNIGDRSVVKALHDARARFPGASFVHTEVSKALRKLGEDNVFELSLGIGVEYDDVLAEIDEDELDDRLDDLDKRAYPANIKDTGRAFKKLVPARAPLDTIKDFGDLGTDADLEPSRPVSFTTFAPTEAQPGSWHDLLCYIHLPSMQAEIEDDSTRRRDDTVPVRKTKSKTETWIARGTRISVVPRVPGLRVNPERLDIIWEEDWHRAEFRIMADPDAEYTEVDQALNGAVEFFVGALLVGRTPVSIFITDAEPIIPEIREEEATQYRSIFVSYSRKDSDIVSMLGRAHKALGDTVLRDVESIRSGQDWRHELHRMIDASDIFQLFWSDSAQESEHVEEEWRHALKKRKQDFIRPVYWRKPVAPIPPELSTLHFAFVPIDEAPEPHLDP